MTDALDQPQCGFGVESASVKHPRATRNRMIGFDLTSLDGETKCSVVDTHVPGRLVQVHPAFRFPAFRLVTWNFIIGSQRDHAFSCPVVAPAGLQTGTVERRRNPIVRTQATTMSSEIGAT